MVVKYDIPFVLCKKDRKKLCYGDKILRKKQEVGNVSGEW
jgi:hypothetical protein